MAEFKKTALTQAGLDLIAKTQAGNGAIRFTKFQIGNGNWDGAVNTSDIVKTTALRAKKMEFDISSAKYKNEATTELELVISNETNKEAGFNLTEIGIFAMDGTKEILYAVSVADSGKGGWIPAYNTETPASMTIYLSISVANGSAVTVKTESGGLATLKQLNAVADRVAVLEQGAAGCVGVRRKCSDDGTLISSTEWERFGNSVGLVATYARGNEAVDDELMQIWPFNKITPCNLSMDGQVLAYLGDPEFDWTAKNEAVAGSSVMDEIPTEMYYSRWQQKDTSGQNWEYRVFADSPRYPNAIYLRELFQRADGSQADHWYFPIFMGSKNAAGNYVSVAGEIPQYNTSCTTFRAEAKTNGKDWQLIDKWAWDIFAALILCYSADSNARTTFGRGHADWYTSYVSMIAKSGTNVITLPKAAGNVLFVGNTVCIGASGSWNGDVAKDRTITKIETSVNASDAVDVTLDGAAFTTTTTSTLWRSAPRAGETINMLAANGTAGPNDGRHAVRTLWVEDFYATMHTGLDGLNLKFNESKMELEAYVCNDPSKYSDKYDGYELAGEIPLDGNNSNNYERSGWIKKELYDKKYPSLILPVELGNGAGSETYAAAYRWANKNGQRPFAGGAFNNGSCDAPSFLNCSYGFGRANWYCASRPLKR